MTMTPPAIDRPPDLLSVSEAARLLALSPQTVRDWWHAGRIPGVRIGNTIKLHRDAVYALLTPQTPKGI
jgi:excisionase family DNA binding protein